MKLSGCLLLLVLASHVPGVKKRLKGDDLKAFERWIAMAPATPTTR